MNSGLPSLLDAIFGKKDLASVSLDEMHEVIREFPSFNAAHFFLSKKLKEQSDASFEKESMRTALYFNNVFWLQSILEEEGSIQYEERGRPSHEENGGEIEFNERFTIVESMPAPDPVLENRNTESVDEKTEEHLIPLPIEEIAYPESGAGTVTSFDELLSKYKIEESSTETPVQEVIEPEFPLTGIPDTEVIRESPDVFHEVENSELAPDPGQDEEVENSELAPDPGQDEGVENSELAPDPGQDEFEIREEVLNEYGIFEEVRIKKPDHDLESFVRPIELIKQESLPIEIQHPEIPQKENESIVKKPQDEEKRDLSDQDDYDAFDRPIETYDLNMHELKTDQIFGSGSESESHEVEELNKMPAVAAVFDPTKAESIVFAPYHMIDYFASQGIKLVLEENPVDPFSKQLKSFTDWLKVMKKLPVKTLSVKSDEVETERIRHFAAHSIEERDILTESMAEVLAKQGMYENAIALFQKLSLIYPPKSAYFASRIEQLKASLP